MGKIVQTHLSENGRRRRMHAGLPQGSKLGEELLLHTQFLNDHELIRKLGNGAFGVVNLYKRMNDGLQIAGKSVHWNEYGDLPTHLYPQRDHDLPSFMPPQHHPPV